MLLRYSEIISRAIHVGLASLSGAPLRLKILLLMLLMVSVAGAAYTVQTWRLKSQLARISRDTVAEFNVESSLPSDVEPGTETSTTIVCSYRYLLFGPATGKITFSISPKCYEKHETREERFSCAVCSGKLTNELTYVYLRGSDGWKFHESYLCRGHDSH